MYNIISFFIPTPSKIFSFISKRILGPFYLHSHTFYVKDHHLGSHWEKFGEDRFEITLCLAHEYSKNDDQASQFAIRNISDKIYKSALVRFKAWHDKTTYEEKFELSNWDNQVSIFTLTQVPIQTLSWKESGHIAIPYTHFQISIENIKDKNGIDQKECKTPEYHPSYTYLLNSTWRHRWGTVWNLDSIERAKRNFLKWFDYIVKYPFEPKILYARRNMPKKIPKMMYVKAVLLVVTKILLKFLKLFRIPSLFFWLILIFRIRIFDDNGKLVPVT